jgi:hypothetical protein
MLAAHTVEEAPAGASRVALRFSFAGMLGTPVAWLFRSTTTRYLAQELASLKRIVEQTRGAIR